MVLSNDRAFTVMGYLQDKGIPAGRLSFKGLGPTKPLKPNAVSYTHLRAHETVLDLVCRLLLEKKTYTSHVRGTH